MEACTLHMIYKFVIYGLKKLNFFSVINSNTCKYFVILELKCYIIINKIKFLKIINIHNNVNCLQFSNN